MYFLTVRGESRIWSLSQSSSAIRSSPQVRFSAAIRRIKHRTSADTAGRPTGFDFQRQKRRNAARCRPQCGWFDDYQGAPPLEEACEFGQNKPIGGCRWHGFLLALFE